jgi:hypothetical protein
VAASTRLLFATFTIALDRKIEEPLRPPEPQPTGLLLAGFGGVWLLLLLACLSQEALRERRKRADKKRLEKEKEQEKEKEKEQEAAGDAAAVLAAQLASPSALGDKADGGDEQKAADDGETGGARPSASGEEPQASGAEEDTEEGEIEEDREGEGEGEGEGEEPISELRQALLEYLDCLQPSVFSAAHSYRRALLALQEGASVLLPFYAVDLQTRLLAAFALMTSFSLDMYLLAAFLSLYRPIDDGSCTAHGSEDSCLARKQPFSPSTPYCSFSNTSDPVSWPADRAYTDPDFFLVECSYRAPEISALFGIFIGCGVAAVAAVPALLISRALAIIMLAPAPTDQHASGLRVWLRRRLTSCWLGMQDGTRSRRELVEQVGILFSLFSFLCLCVCLSLYIYIYIYTYIYTYIHICLSLYVLTALNLIHQIIRHADSGMESWTQLTTA